jgi:hypothetical protein
MEILITIYDEKVEDGGVHDFGRCPLCGWEVPAWEPNEWPEELRPEIPPDHEEYDYAQYLIDSEPDYYLGNIYNVCNGEQGILHFIFLCPKCKTPFGVQMTP